MLHFLTKEQSNLAHRFHQHEPNNRRSEPKNYDRKMQETIRGIRMDAFKKNIKVEISNHANVILKECKFMNEFHETLNFLESKMNKHEKMNIIEWYKPYLYFEIIDTRWKHYPCYCRALVSFDITNGKVASFLSKSRYQFARKGQFSRISSLIHYDVTRFEDCGKPENIERC